MFEISVFYYVVCTLYIFLEVESTLALVSAWLFVVSRIFQAVVHITYNKAPYRMLVFAISILCELFLWVGFIVSLS
ncbi:MAPEG family protein [Aestuariicella hydrocarbonica]|uniref:MAPEG family protein n=1 Tax=Pseudomaricurvus hydrocarbonicus TaxID=1470433 RepID=A0A9E5MMX8_9GAMM|nr:MAPEG family protein [Aestuariicella hydrocarbonica]